jgi:hypothetical protein
MITGGPVQELRSVNPAGEVGTGSFSVLTLRGNGDDRTSRQRRGQIVGLRRSGENGVGLFQPRLLRFGTFDQN